MIPSILQPVRAKRLCEFRAPARRDPGHKRNRAECDAKKPEPIEGAQWQAGVTPDNEFYRILLNGLPCPLAFAASEKEGWVMCFEERADLRFPGVDSGAHISTENLASARRLRGKVRIVRGE